MEFYHVSIDIKDRNKEFIPRIPKHRCKDEDGTSKRVCVCLSLEEAISGFPYKDLFVNYYVPRRKSNYLIYYKTETDNYISSEELKYRVPDAHITNEHWITEPFKAIGEVIKINELKLKGYNKYCNTYHGAVTKLDYEKEVEDYDRETEFHLTSKRNLKKFEKICQRENIKLEVLEDRHVHLWHSYYGYTTKNYRWIRIKLSIPAGSNMRDLWLIDDEQNNYALRKKVVLKEYKNYKSFYEDDLDFDDIDSEEFGQTVSEAEIVS